METVGRIVQLTQEDNKKITGALVDSTKLVGELMTWQPIATAPRDTLKVCGPTLILGHDTKKWIRFGKWYVQERCWYYSGTSERSQYAQVRGDEPTHWMPMPDAP